MYMCVGVCIDVVRCAYDRIPLSTLRMDVYIDTCIDMCMDLCIDMCTDLCIDMCMDRCIEIS